MLYRLIYIIVFLLFFSCDFDDAALAVSDINEDELKYKNFSLNLEFSDTVRQLPEIGASHLLYAGQLNDTDYVYSVFRLDNEIFQDYELCNNDSLSYENLYLVIDLINKYKPEEQINNQNIDYNIGNDFYHDIPPLLAYWIDYSVLLYANGDSILNQDWLESDIKEFKQIDINLQAKVGEMFVHSSFFNLVLVIFFYDFLFS